MTTTFLSFARQHNRDSTIDSIGTVCYQTIASGESETALEAAENLHSRDPNGDYSLIQTVDAP